MTTDSRHNEDDRSVGSEVIVLSELPDHGFAESWFELVDADHFWCRWRIGAFLAQLRDLGIATDQPALGLDIGCGKGVVREQLISQTSWALDGVETNRTALELNRGIRGNIYQYDIHDRNPELEESYDFVILFDVLEHIPDDETNRFLESCMFHLKPGGHIFVNVPALEALRSQFDDLGGHYRRYTKTMLRGELERARFGVLDLRYWGLLQIPLLLARKLLLRPMQDRDEAVKKGFRPPSATINTILTLLARLELALLHRPPLGTSVLGVGRKPSHG